jgi:hypothetical protein
MGISAFIDPEVVTALGLTDAQKTKIAAIRTEGMAKLADLRPGGPFGQATDSTDVNAYRDASRKLTGEMVRQVVESFTPEQKKAWADLVGDSADAAPAVAPRPTGPTRALLVLMGRGGVAGSASRLTRQIALIENERFSPNSTSTRRPATP